MKFTLVAPPWEVMINSYPPLGLGYVAGATRAAGFATSILDFGLKPHASVSEVVEAVLAQEPDLVGITTWTHLYHVCCEIAQAIKRRRPELKVVMGGPHVTIFPAETLEEEPAVDYVVFGEGEATIVELLQAVGEERLLLNHIPGLAWRQGSQAVKNEERAFNTDLDNLPFPARDLMQVERYPLKAWDGEPMTTIMSSRGCPYACTYCFKGLFGRRYMTTDIDVVFREMDAVHEAYGMDHFYFVDDLFVVNIKRLEAFMDTMRKRGVPYRWQVLARVDRLKQDHYRQMAETGCSKIHYGIETGDPEVMLRVDKAATLEQVHHAVNWCHEAGVMAKGYFMIGLPGETEASARRTIDMACELPLHEAMFSLTTPFPGTALWKEVAHRFEGIPKKELFKRASYYYGSRNVSEPMFNLSELPTERLIELINEAEYEFRTRGFRARKLQRELGSGLDRWIFRLTQRKWVKRLGVGPFRNLGKKWLRTRTGSTLS